MSESKAQSKRGKVQIVLLVDQEIATALDTLRIIGATSRARITEPLLAGAVRRDLAKGPYSDQVPRVERLAERAGLSVAEYVAAYARAYAKSTYGPGLDALEADDREVTGRPVAA